MIESRRGVGIQVLVAGLLIASVLPGCAGRKKGEGPTLTAVIVVGGAKRIDREGNVEDLGEGTRLTAGEGVAVGGSAKVKLVGDWGSVVYVNQNTDFTVKAADNRRAVGTPGLKMAAGEVYALCGDTSAGEEILSITTPLVTCMGVESRFAVRHRERTTVVTVLGGEVTAMVAGSTTTFGPCTKHVIREEGGSGRAESIFEDDLEHLRRWVGRGNIASALRASGCSAQPAKAENFPPLWENRPRAVGEAGSVFHDTIRAYDPESTAVHFELVEGPAGMRIDSLSGVIMYRPKRKGRHGVLIRVSDEEGASADVRYELVVEAATQKEPRVVLTCPQQTLPHEPVTFDASGSRDPITGRKGLTYRFDIDGDGTWEYPKDGTFGADAVVGHTYQVERGRLEVVVELKNREGKTARVSQPILVNAPPVARLTIEPEVIAPGSEVTLDASASSDGYDPGENLTVRWDLDGDTAWDYPEESAFTKSKIVKYTWDSTGTYTVRLQVRDSFGSLADTGVVVEVTEKLRADSLLGPDTVGVGGNVELRCSTAVAESVIVGYEWDLDGDNLYDRKTDLPRLAHSYESDGRYTVSCRLTDRDGRTAVVRRTITVTNAPATVDAGGPYRTQVNTEVALSGKASDPDNEIVSYSWDFDGDGKGDWSSSKEADTRYTFRRAGEYVISFVVKTDDGKVSSDTARVIVDNEPPEARAGEDVVSSAGRKVVLKGRGRDPDGTIVKYEWDFDGDGTYDWSSEDTGYVEHEFGEFTDVVLRVTDSDGETATDTMRMVICPEDMVPVEEGKFCVDRYEWPNRKGDLPLRNVTYEQAEAKCRETGKRLCTAAEWTMACAGSGRRRTPYPYGKRFDKESCNTLGNSWRHNEPAKAGNFVKCRSTCGALDMSGNVAEWVSTSGGAEPFAFGGSWQSSEKDSRCDSRVSLKKDKKYFYTGFRCCK